MQQWLNLSRKLNSHLTWKITDKVYANKKKKKKLRDDAERSPYIINPLQKITKQGSIAVQYCTAVSVM